MADDGTNIDNWQMDELKAMVSEFANKVPSFPGEETWTQSFPDLKFEGKQDFAFENGFDQEFSDAITRNSQPIVKDNAFEGFDAAFEEETKSEPEEEPEKLDELSIVGTKVSPNELEATFTIDVSNPQIQEEGFLKLKYLDF